MSYEPIRGQSSKKVSNSPALRWCLTINDIGDILSDKEATARYGEFQDRMRELFNSGVVTYFICQFEKVSHIHLQCFLILKEKKRFKFIKDNITSTGHIEKAIASTSKNIAYCTKSDSFYAKGFELGTSKTKQGRRTDLLELKELIKSSAEKDVPFEQIMMDNDSAFKFSRQAERLYRYQQSKNRPYVLTLTPLSQFDPSQSHLCVVVLYGQSGVGKSRKALELASKYKLDVYRKTDGNAYLDGYSNQQCIIWEEYANTRIVPEIGNLLTLMDIYRPFTFHARYQSAIVSNLKLLIFTSPYHPKDWYTTSDNNVTAILRRISDIIEIAPQANQNSSIPVASQTAPQANH